MEKIRNILRALLPQEKFDAIAVGVIDFKTNSFEIVEATHMDGLQIVDNSVFYYDLASLTKPLTNSLGYFLKPKNFTNEMLLCLSHRGGLPAWGLLPHHGWKEQILNYPIKESSTLYSDFSALRVMLEFNKKDDLKATCQSVWDKDLVFWTDLPRGANLLQYGHKNGHPNFGEVHDPNAWVIHDFCSHAGLFSTVSGLCQTLLNYQKKTSFIDLVKKDLGTHTHRFSYGWDRVENPDSTLAGKGCGPRTFGHLGFTGTSIWIDPDRLRGHVILSNATKEHWYDKQGLNDIRRAVGETVWGM